MGRLVALFVAGMGFLIAGSLGASAPVKVTITGCVTGGVLMSEKTVGTPSSGELVQILPGTMSSIVLSLSR